MDPLYLLVITATLGAAGVVFAVQYFGASNVIKRAIRAAPRRRIGEATSGEIVRVTGRVESTASPLLAPLSLRKCAYYDAIVEEILRGGPRRLGGETRGHEFLVRDGSGVALVRPEGAEIVLTYDFGGDRGRLFSADVLPDEVDALLLRNRIEAEKTGSLLTPTLAWREGVLAEGEIVTVVGRGRWEDAAGAGYRDDSKKRLVIEAPGEQKILITDDRSVVLEPRP